MLWESALKETGIHEYGVIAAAEIPFPSDACHARGGRQ